MSKQLNNNTLPIEILKKIFQNLLIVNNQSKKDLKTCSSVCKSWKAAAQDVFGKISIKVNEHSLEKLSTDIIYFAQKVKSIELMKKNRFTEDLDRTVTCLVWLDIILACPNLVSIKISVNNAIDYVQCLWNISTERLAHIQSFKTSSPILHLQLNLHYCKSITSLSILVGSATGFPGSNNNNELVYFISKFPKLTFIRFNDLYDYGGVFDLIQFLEVAHQLQKLFIHYFEKVKSSSKIIPDNPCLIVLRLTVKTMDINSLIFITTGLKKLNKLRLRIGNLIIGEPQNIFGIRKNYSPKELLDDLKDYTSGISKLFIKYKYEGETYKLGKEPEVFSDEDFDSDDIDDSDYYYDSDDYNENDYYYDSDYYDSSYWLDDDSDVDKGYGN